MSRAYNKARWIIRAAYNNQPNPLTPDVLNYGMFGKALAWELSEGTGIDHAPLFAVTVIEDTGDPLRPKYRHDLNRTFPTHADALAYIRDGFRSTAASDTLAALIEEGDANGWG